MQSSRESPHIFINENSETMNDYSKQHAIQVKMIYLPEREEDNPFDAQELCKRLVRCQLFSKQVVEKNQGI